VGADLGQRTRQVGFIQAKGRQQQGLGRGQAFKGGFAGDHYLIL
jgi:hypothetical protein